MGQSGWRLPDELLKRVRVRCAEEGVRQNAWVERALEKALGAEEHVPERAVPAPPRPSVPEPDPDRRRPVARKPKTSPAKPEALAEIRESLKGAKPPAGIPRIAPRHWAP